MDQKRIHTISHLVGVAVIFSIGVGFIAMLFGIISFFLSEFSAAGLSLIAAALGFGLFMIAALKS
jgi:hypothetical protein